MDADLDTLATALYVTTDDLLRAHPERVPVRPRVGSHRRSATPSCSPLAVMQALLGFTSETRWLRYARAHCSIVPATAPAVGLQQAAAQAGRHDGLAGQRAGRPDQHRRPTTCGSSTPPRSSAPAPARPSKRSDLAGWAEYGYCASHSRFFWGLRLHLVCTLHGLPDRLGADRRQSRRTRRPHDILAATPAPAVAEPAATQI